MPTQIIDNFDLTSQLPLDARLVVGPNAFFQTKDAIQNKYYGLRVWDFNEGLPYVWTGSAWENENSGSVLVSNGQGGFLSKFTGTGTSNTITKSIIYESVSGSVVKVGIGNFTPAETLDVNGNIKSSGIFGFIGKGGSITEISATNITTGFLGLNRLFTAGAVANSILFYNGASTIWRPQAQIRVASATGIEVTEDNTNANVHDLLFYIDTNTVTDTITPTSYKVKSSDRLQFKPSTGQLRLSNGTSLDPGFTFKGHPNGRAGMFLDFSNGDWWNGGLVITFEQNQGVGVTDNTSKGERLRIIGGGGSPAFGGNWASNFFFHSNNYISKNLLLSVSDGGVTAAAPGKATFTSNGLSEVEWLNQGNFTIGSSTLRTTTTINGSLTISPNALTNQALTINGTTNINGNTSVLANFTVGAFGNLKTATINGSLIVGGTTAEQFQVSGMKALFTGSQISMGLSHDTTLQGGILPKLVVKSSFDDANDGKVALFTNGFWSGGKSAIIYLGDGNHYLSSTYGTGPFKIYSTDGIQINSQLVGKIDLMSKGNSKIFIDDDETILQNATNIIKNQAQIFDQNFVSSQFTWPLNNNEFKVEFSAVNYDRIIYAFYVNNGYRIVPGGVNALRRVFYGTCNYVQVTSAFMFGTNGDYLDSLKREQTADWNMSFIIPAGLIGSIYSAAIGHGDGNGIVKITVMKLGRS